jgi:phage baseplate assembly protein W
MELSSEQFIGVGWKFPVEFNTASNSAAMLSGEELIKNSLDVLFVTNMGERIMQPDYGSELDEFVFENLSRSMITYLEAVISDAILFNEPRIMVNEIEIDPQIRDGAFIEIKIDYTILSTNNRYNYVYPYYLKEGTNLVR